MEQYLSIFNKEENCDIKAKLFINQENKNYDSFFIFCHGFCSGKGSKSVSIIANKLLEYEIPSISFDFPGHFDSTQGADKLNVEVCISYINTIIEYVKKEYGENIKISFFAISFGAYVLLNKLIGDKANYDNIVLRSPAFKMKDILLNCLIKEPFEQYEKSGKVKAGFGGKIEVPYSFYEDLKTHNLYENYHENRKILIIQGALDDTAPIEDTYEFIKNKPEIELLKIENMKHHMEPEELEKIADMLVKKLNFRKS